MVLELVGLGVRIPQTPVQEVSDLIAAVVASYADDVVADVDCVDEESDLMEDGSGMDFTKEERSILPSYFLPAIAERAALALSTVLYSR